MDVSLPRRKYRRKQKVSTTPATIAYRNGVGYNAKVIKLGIHWIFLLLVFSTASCEYSHVNMRGMPDTAYHKTLQTQTKYERLYGLDKTLYDTYITYFTPELAQLYVDEYAKIYSASDAKRKTMVNDEIGNATKYDEFIIGHYASDNDNQRLNTTNPDKIVWKFLLQSNSGTSVEPVDITPLTLGTQLNYFYPYLHAWSRLYRVRFPKTNSNTKHLVMKGPIRELTFIWN